MKINGQKLKEALQSRGYTYLEAGELIGRSHGYFYNIIRGNSINIKAVGVIERVLGIPVSEYAEEEITTPSTIVRASNKDEIKDAIKEVLVENADELNYIIFSAVYGAMKKANRDFR